METLTVNKLDRYRDCIQNILANYTSISYSNAQIENTAIASQDRNHFLIISEGWEGKRRIHRTLVHIQIRNEKIWIHFDGTADGVVEQLLTAGVPKSDIVLAFHPSHIREKGDFAID
ncbi:MAG: XisI protein [Spirulina sp.]